MTTQRPRPSLTLLKGLTSAASACTSAWRRCFGLWGVLKNSNMRGQPSCANAPLVILFFWCQPSFFCAFQFHQQNCTQICQCKQLENTLKFYAVHQFGINPLVQKLLVGCWWNWPNFSQNSPKTYFKKALISTIWTLYCAAREPLALSFQWIKANYCCMFSSIQTRSDKVSFGALSCCLLSPCLNMDYIYFCFNK